MEKLINKYAHILSAFQEQMNKINRLWNVEKETAELLSFLVLIKKPKIILELGTSNGFSTFYMAIHKSSKIITIDVEKARQDLAKINLNIFENIEFISERIEDYIPKINYEIDFLFIDANKPNYLKYLQILEKKLTNGAIIVADNIDSHKTTKIYNDYVKNSKTYTTIHLSIDSGLLISYFNKEYLNMDKGKISFQNSENNNLTKLLNPLVKKNKTSNLENILKDIEEEMLEANNETNETKNVNKDAQENE
ncbi:MAG: class I SAM-dependent methyltransferase [Candidatus Cloacimonetes bacterium]|nr:class I SAM-dependent methyltransferase [Candidatus Cloacimonadota bacterium]